MKKTLMRILSAMCFRPIVFIFIALYILFNAQCFSAELSQKLQWKIKIVVTYFEKNSCKIRPYTKRCLQFLGYLDSKSKSYTDLDYRPCGQILLLQNLGLSFCICKNTFLIIFPLRNIHIISYVKMQTTKKREAAYRTEGRDKAPSYKPQAAN